MVAAGIMLPVIPNLSVLPVLLAVLLAGVSDATDHQATPAPPGRAIIAGIQVHGNLLASDE